MQMVSQVDAMTKQLAGLKAQASKPAKTPPAASNTITAADREAARALMLRRRPKPIQMAAPAKTGSSKLQPDGKPWPTKPTPEMMKIHDQSNFGEWGDLDRDAIFSALSRILTSQDGTKMEFPRCIPVNLASMISQCADQPEEETENDRWESAFENAPMLWAQPEPTSMNSYTMGLKGRRDPRPYKVTASDRRKVRKLRGLPPIVMDLVSAAPKPTDEQASDPAWGDVDSEQLFASINLLLKTVDPDGAVGEFPVCEAKDLGKNLAAVASKLEKLPRKKADAVTMGLRSQQRKPVDRGFTEEDRAKARKLRGLK
jgi:hypothetical protein